MNGEGELGCYIQTWCKDDPRCCYFAFRFAGVFSRFLRTHGRSRGLSDLSNDFQLCLLTPIVALLWKKNKKLAYTFLAAVLVAMHVVVLAETSFFSLSVCDMKISNPPYGSGDDAPPHSGDFQILLYDKPW